MPPLSLLFRRASTSMKLSMLSMFFLALSLCLSQFGAYQQRQQQQALSATIAKRNAAIAQLSSELDKTEKWIKQLDSSGKMTSADSKHIDARMQQYKARLKSLDCPPCP